MTPAPDRKPPPHPVIATIPDTDRLRDHRLPDTASSLHALPTPGGRFDVLDGIRGIAAFMVVLHHYTQYSPVPTLNGSSGVVDLFFMLSGFVLMCSYARKIEGGMRLGAFVMARLSRLGPMYLVGLGLGLLAALIHLARGVHDALDTTAVATAFGLNLLLIPYLNSDLWPFGNAQVPGPTFPLNDPSWSMFFQLFANAVFYGCLIGLLRLRRVRLGIILIAACSLALLAGLMAHSHEFNPGWGTDNFWSGFPRVIGWFFLGAVIFMFHDRLPTAYPRLTLGLFGLMLTMFVFSGGRGRWLCLFVVSPSLILLASRVEVTGRLRWLCATLGDVSYPLYITHFPIYRLLQEIDRVRTVEPYTQFAVSLLIALLMAAAFTRLDQRIQRLLQQRRRSAATGHGNPAPG